jgi:hypothetical protein
MNEKLDKSLDGILLNVLRHCGRFRLNEYNLSAVRPEEARAVVALMLDYFEEEVDRLSSNKSAGSEGNTPSSSGNSGASPLERLRLSLPNSR